jgi:hypothetical protein
MGKFTREVKNVTKILHLVFLCFLLNVEVIYTQNLSALDDIREKILGYLGINNIYRNNIESGAFFRTLQLDNEFTLRLTRDDFGNYYYHFYFNNHRMIFFEKLNDNEFSLINLQVKINEETPFYSFFPFHDMASILEEFNHILNSGIYYINGLATITYVIESRHSISFSFEDDKLVLCGISILVD